MMNHVMCFSLIVVITFLTNEDRLNGQGSFLFWHAEAAEQYRRNVLNNGDRIKQ
jgi:hypothetical protein